MRKHLPYPHKGALDGRAVATRQERRANATGDVIMAIANLQRALKVVPDGEWGPVSNEALREFCKNTGVYTVWK
jgi:hypothetical protein